MTNTCSPVSRGDISKNVSVSFSPSSNNGVPYCWCALPSFPDGQLNCFSPLSHFIRLHFRLARVRALASLFPPLALPIVLSLLVGCALDAVAVSHRSAEGPLVISRLAHCNEFPTGAHARNICRASRERKHK
eukprot:GHVT01024946.1.p1 GENE.GHVT01024946.1~~GHVT01024946.1.p1  ORF type:complete len:132 (+),score=3.26 GHVT01024946.1:1109-1504(+)